MVSAAVGEDFGAPLHLGVTVHPQGKFWQLLAVLTLVMESLILNACFWLKLADRLNFLFLKT